MVIHSYYTRTPGREVRRVDCRVTDHVDGIPMLLPFVRCAPNDTVQRYFVQNLYAVYMIVYMNGRETMKMYRSFVDMVEE